MIQSDLEHAIAFWKLLDLGCPPFAHPSDFSVLDSFEQHADFQIVEKHLDFVSGIRFGNFDDTRFHLSLLPIPFCGDIRVADIFILLLNPGVSLGDYYPELDVPAFRRRLEMNLVQQVDREEFPFIWLDPEYSWTSGFDWWERKLRNVIKRIADEKFGGSYIVALRDVSRRMAHIELVPYRSSSFRAHKLIDKLESVRVARRMAEYIASDKSKTVIVTRQVDVWNLNQGGSNVILYRKGETRGASLGPESRGGQAILRCYGILS